MLFKLEARDYWGELEKEKYLHASDDDDDGRVANSCFFSFSFLFSSFCRELQKERKIMV